MLLPGRRLCAVGVFGLVEVAVAVLVGGGEDLHQLWIGRGLRHRDATILVRVERVERPGLSRGCRRIGRGRLGGESGRRQQRDERSGKQSVHALLLHPLRWLHTLSTSIRRASQRKPVCDHGLGCQGLARRAARLPAHRDKLRRGCRRAATGAGNLTTFSDLRVACRRQEIGTRRTPTCMSAVAYCGTVGQTTTLRRARSHEITSARRCECRIAAHRINFTLCTGGVAMDWERISGNWAHWRERIQARWSRLTNYQLDKA